MINNSNPKDNDVPSNDDANDMYYSIAENLFQSISSMVLNIIHTTMTGQKQLTARGSNWNNTLPWSNISDQMATKHKTIARKNVVNKYKLPVPKDLLQRIDRTSSPAHVGKLRNAIDFIVDNGTPVLAANNGIVTFVKDNSNTGGPDPIYWRHTNFIVIMHSNGEYSRYDHLSYNSSKVKVGQYVRVGEEIAKVGMTGYTYLPHLHFQVFIVTGINVWTDFDTLEIQDFSTS